MDTFHDESVFSFSPNAFGSIDYSSIDSVKDLTVIEFEEMYISSITREWIWLSVTLILGLYGSWLIYRESKYWPIVVLLISGAALIHTFPGTIKLINQSSTVIEHFARAGRLLLNSINEGEGFHRYYLLSSIFAWPFYCLALFSYSGYVLAIRFRKNENVA